MTISDEAVEVAMQTYAFRPRDGMWEVYETAPPYRIVDKRGDAEGARDACRRRNVHATLECADLALARENERLRAQLAEAIEALRPFAEQSDSWPKAADGDALSYRCMSLSVGNCRRARAIVSRVDAQKGNADE